MAGRERWASLNHMHVVNRVGEVPDQYRACRVAIIANIHVATLQQ